MNMHITPAPPDRLLRAAKWSRGIAKEGPAPGELIR